MKPFRKNVAIAIDGGGIRGLIVTQALSILESYLKKPLYDIFRLTAGTSTGSIIAAGIGAGISGQEMTQEYLKLGENIFQTTFRKLFFPLTRYMYSDIPLKEALNNRFYRMDMGDFWLSQKKTDVVITAYDLKENRTRFIKPWKKEYLFWPVAKAVQASCTVPALFPPVDNRYIDGGVGSYANPCYIAAYEAKECLNWKMEETTLISIGTGRAPCSFTEKQVKGAYAWDWLRMSIGAFMQSAYDQQINLIHTHYGLLDFRRFQIDLLDNIASDDISKMPDLLEYGKILGRMIIEDRYDNPITNHQTVDWNPDES